MIVRHVHNTKSLFLLGFLFDMTIMTTVALLQWRLPWSGVFLWLKSDQVLACFGLFSLHQDSAVLKNIQMGVGKCIFWFSQLDLILNVILMSF